MKLFIKLLPTFIKLFSQALKKGGPKYALGQFFRKLHLSCDPTIDALPEISCSNITYRIWLSRNMPRAVDLRRMASTIDLLPNKPLVSIIMPVFNTPENFLCEAIESVLSQVYPHWELCIADDASTKEQVKKILNEYAAKDSRIRVVFRPENGHISMASNSALDIASGEMIALLDHDDLLTPDALYEVALLLNHQPEADMIYTDEDKLDDQQNLMDPFFKPDWCPDSFLSRMYTCHLGVYRLNLVKELGGFRSGYEGSQDYDLVLRLTERTDKIFHIPKILYHWRIHPNSAASSPKAKPYAYVSAENALNDALRRRNEPGTATMVPGLWGLSIVRYSIREDKLVSIIVPTRNQGLQIDACLNSIFSRSQYKKFEVIIIDNGSTEKELKCVLEVWKKRERSRLRYYYLDIPFNYSTINNFAVKQTQGEFLLFLNNDTEVITPDWIDAMVEQAQRPSIGAVGPLLLYPNGTIQSAGILLGVGGIASESHKHLPSSIPGHFGYVKTVNNVTALPGACLLCRREVYENIGGFDETLAVAYGDVDLCLKMIDKGLRNVYLPHVQLYHQESLSRGKEKDTPEKLGRLAYEAGIMLSRWGTIIQNDPCYNINLSRDIADFRIRL